MSSADDNNPATPEEAPSLLRQVLGQDDGDLLRRFVRAAFRLAMAGSGRPG